MNNAPKIRLTAAGVANNGGIIFRKELRGAPGQSVELVIGRNAAHGLGFKDIPQMGDGFDLTLGPAECGTVAPGGENAAADQGKPTTIAA